jgi:hypothetical protein
MNLLEIKILDTLKDLKENHHVVSVKAEFETEGTKLDEALRLKEIISNVGLDLTIKIGGCGAIKDMYDAKKIGVCSIIAPMIESCYAMEKYINATKFVFNDEERKNIKFLINLETITGYLNFKDMVNSPCFSDVAGIVLGRDDMTGSMNLKKEDINSEKIFDIANNLSISMQKLQKDMIVGGGVTVESLPFFSKLPYISRFETRKIIFDAQKSLKDKNVEQGILKAIEFEFLWLKNKREFYGIILKEDEIRLQMLETIYKKLGEIYA